MKKQAIIVDIDGTIAEKYFLRTYYEYDKVGLDSPIQEVIDIIKILQESGLYTVFLTGRKEDSRDVTNEWLSHNIGLENSVLFMREDGDKRPDFVVKEEIYIRDIEPEYEVLAVFEDRKRNVKMFRDLGLLTFQHVEGDY